MTTELNKSDGEDCSDKEQSGDQEQYKLVLSIIKLKARSGLEHLALRQKFLAIWPSTTAIPEHHTVISDIRRLPPFCTSSNTDHENKEALSTPLTNEDEDDLDIYEYIPLSSYRSIRVVQIYDLIDRSVPTTSLSEAPSMPSQREIRCSLVEVSIDDLPLYWALSYTWGNPRYVVDSDAAFRSSHPGQERCYPIKCDGKVLLVTSNLHEFLLRYQNYHIPYWKGMGYNIPRYFWIDAICVNQSDLQEKSSQVSMMNIIYRHATKVIVWLGELDIFTRPAMEAINTLLDLNQSVESLESLRSIDITEQGEQVPFLKEISPWNCLALYAFMSRQWFYRAWIVQEFILPQEICCLCGSIEIPLLSLLRLSDILEKTGWGEQINNFARADIAQQVPYDSLPIAYRSAVMDPSYQRTLYAIERDFVEIPIKNLFAITNLKSALGIKCTGLTIVKRYKPPLLEILSGCRNFKATNPRDKIYAFLELSGEEEDPTMRYLAPDYNRSVESLYIDVARYIIESNKSLELLSHVECPSLSRITGLPSWVPDWSIDGPPTMFGAAVPITHFNASRGLSFEATTSIRGTNLHTRGILVDTIAEVAEHAGRDPLASIAKVLLGIPKSYPNTIKIVNGLFIDKTDERGVPIPLAMMEPGDNDLADFAMFENWCESRVEAFWRTLLINICGGHKPAPLKFGYAFSDWLNLYLGKTVLRNKLAGRKQFSEIIKDFGDIYMDIVYPWVKIASEEPDIAIESSIGKEADNTTEPRGTIRFLLPYDRHKAHITNALFSPQDLGIDFGRLQVFQKQLNLVNSQRTIYRTSKGLLGNCFYSVKAGDEIWILPGAKSPLIFRRAKGEVGIYTLHGESYVHGIMNGEVVAAASRAVLKWLEGFENRSLPEEIKEMLQDMIII